MTGWAKKRFWKDAQIAESDAGFAIHLDGRAVKTPAKAPLVVPTRRMAEAIAAEWQAQGADIDPVSMPVTRSANAAIDKVKPQHAEVVEIVAAYGDSDLLCYRAEAPEALVARQASGWDPVLEWSAAVLDAPLAQAAGVIHVPQKAASLENLTRQTAAFSAFELTGFHDLVAISGSLVLAFAVARGHMTPQAAWELSRIDEHWQAELWGADDEAVQAEEHKRLAFLHAARFLDLARQAG